MLVNNRAMCSFMDNGKLDQLIDGLRGSHEAVSATQAKGE